MAEKKYCEFCKKEISVSNWSKHLKANIHEKNVKKFLNPTTITETETTESLLTQSPSPKQTIIPDYLIEKIGKVPNVIVTQKFKKATLMVRINLETKNVERYFSTLSDIIHQIDKFHYKIGIAANVELSKQDVNVTHIIRSTLDPIISSTQALEVIYSQLNYVHEFRRGIWMVVDFHYRELIIWIFSCQLTRKIREGILQNYPLKPRL